MKHKKSYSKMITVTGILTVFSILIISYILLISYFFNKESKHLRATAVDKTGLVNMYCISKIKNRSVKSYIESYNNNLISEDTLKKYIKLSNDNGYKLRSSISFDGINFYPKLNSDIRKILFNSSDSKKIKNRVVTDNGTISILNIFYEGKVKAVSVYYLSEDPVLKKNLKVTSVEGFYFKRGIEEGVGWLINGSKIDHNDLTFEKNYCFGTTPQNILIENTMGIDGLSFIVSDKDQVQENNHLIIFLGLVFFIILLIISIVGFLLRNRLLKYLDEVVNDTRDLAYSGNSNSIRNRNYKYIEFQSLIDAFLTVLDSRESVEAQLIKSKDRMEELILLRTKELTAAVEKAEEANRSKMNFLATVSHEIRTPMNCIIGFCELIISEGTDQGSSDYAKRIVNESETLLHLINDILDHSKIASGKMKLDVNRVYVDKFIQDIVALGNPYDQGSKVAIGYSIDSYTPKFIGVDEVRLYQVVSNIYFNALKYTPSGSVSIAVSHNRLGRDGKKIIEISVSDTGIGIPKDRIATVFDSYEQLGDALTQGFRGTGLGLTITKQIVEFMGGSIIVTSQPGIGSCFTVEIPVSNVDQYQDITETVVKAPEDKLSSGRILVVEDYPTNRIVARKHLEGSGYGVIEVENGQEAVDICYRDKFDLILMDIQMPVMDGFTATKIIRESEGLNINTPIIAMTANGLQSIKEECFECGMNNIILKPIRRNSFLEVVKMGLKGDVVV